MAYSSIIQKKCKCSPSCNSYPDLGFAGYSKYHAPKEMLDEKLAKHKAKQKQVNSANRAKRNLRTLATDTPEIKPPKGYVDLDIWFKERRKEMQNVCCECGRGTSKHNDNYYKWSICHIVPKGLVPSVATNEFNWIELCQLHHQEFDSTFDKAKNMQCFGEVRQKFELFKHLIPSEEKRKVNPHLIEYIKY